MGNPRWQGWRGFFHVGEMAKDTAHRDDQLSPAGLEALLRLLVTHDGSRVSSAIVDGRTVWIKRLGAGRGSLGKWMHAALRPLAPRDFLRSSPRLDGPGRADREMRKTAAFRAAGFPAVDVLYRRGDLLVLSNAGTIVTSALAGFREVDPARHDALLVACAEALGRAHAAGLCHGRPHPRDMFIDGDEIGFLDFEEEPEAVMPLDAAQARDVWLLFHQIASRAIAPDTSARALAAYRRAAPAQAVAQLRSLVRFFGAFLPMMRAAGSLAGRDGQRLLAGTSFLQSALTADGDSPQSLPVAGEIAKDGS